ncbi:hypothetical protein P9D43_29995 [Neobacillus niacini]|uniref:hypothetical protein n=1 Tax=Neobacillus niacini TaxID=86668 RepID=UPI0007ABF697|nr:hypothetical protein [Neobacillus niacini]MEC1526203.1 hypothetical protein [Neobacillus niacini]
MIKKITPLFHGTSLDEAREILTQQLFKGKKAFRHHRNGYVSFTTDMIYAANFGHIVLEFHNGIPSAIKVPYGNIDWFYENQELTEYIIKRKFNEVDVSTFEFLIEDEFIVPMQYAFELSKVNLHIMTRFSEGIDELVKNQIQNEFGQIVNVIDSRHMLEDYLKEEGIRLL